MSKNPTRVIAALDQINRKMDALRAGALTTDEAIAKAAKDAKELREMFPLDVDAVFKDGRSIRELLDDIKKLQQTDFGGSKPSDIQGTKSQNIPRQRLEDLPSVQDQMTALRGGVGPGMSTGSGWAAEGQQGRAWGEAGTPSQILEERGAFNQVNLSEANAFADQLEGAVRRFEAGFPNSYFTAVVLAMEIPYLRIGARSVQEAKQYIMSFGPAFLPGFQAALSSPSITPTLRSLTAEAISILQTGNVSASGGTSLGGPAPRIGGAPAFNRPTPAVQTTGGTGSAGIGPSAGGPLGTGAAGNEGVGIAAAVAAAGTRFSQSLDESTRRILARLDPNHFFQPLIDGQIRPMRREIGEVHQQTSGLGARIQGEISQGLERYALSGALTTGTTQ
jgi:hypothetical protein